MKVFEEYLASINNDQHRARVEEIMKWIMDKFPNLDPKIAWNQPMFTHHETFIIGFSASKQHLAVGLEGAEIIHFSEEIKKAGYDHSVKLFRIKWSNPVNFALLEKIIEFNILDKVDCKTFWRK